MHGIVFAELKKYVDERLGGDSWNVLRKEAGLGHKVFLATETYEDKDIVDLVVTAARITGRDVGDILEDFGEFLVPDLLEVYGALVKGEWRTIDFLENVESIIHRTVRLRNPGASPPDLRCERSTERALTMTYTSQRKMCALARGLIHGVARHYGEAIRIDELTCMTRGDGQCQLKVELAEV